MPAESDVAIVNLALMRMGAEPIAALDEADPDSGPAAAQIMSAEYPQARDRLLVEAPWNFAVSRAAPALLGTAPLYGFTKAYQLPQGGAGQPALCLRVMDTNLDPSWSSWWPWAWATGPWPWPWSGVLGLWQVEGRTLVTDEADVQIRYLGQITDPALYPPKFVEALVCELIAATIFKFSRSETAVVRAEKKAKDALAAAINVDAREGSQMRVIDTTLTECR